MPEHLLLKASRILKDAQQKFPAEAAATIEQIYNDIVNLNNFIDKELDAVDANAELDKSGKKKSRRCVIEKAERKFEAIKAKRNYSARSEALKDRPLETPKKEDESVLKFLREKEVRDRLHTMTEGQILSLFGESLFDGSNPLLTEAILNAPTGFEVVSEDNLKRMRRARAKKISPKFSAEIEIVREIHSSVEQMFASVKTELDGLRRKELPATLSQSMESGKRPFKF